MANTELFNFQKKHATGVALELSGAAVAGIGAVLAGGNKAKNIGPGVVMIPVGAIMFLMGWGNTLIAHQHIRNARVILQDGGVAIPIGRKKRAN